MAEKKTTKTTKTKAAPKKVASDEPGNVGVSDDLQILNERLGAPVSDASGEVVKPAKEDTDGNS